jgi:hypothetical protein
MSNLNALEWTYTRTGATPAVDGREGTVAANVAPTQPMLLPSIQQFTASDDPIGESESSCFYWGYADGYHWATKTGSTSIFKSADGVTWSAGVTTAAGYATVGVVHPTNDYLLFSGSVSGGDRRVFRVANPGTSPRTD